MSRDVSWSGRRCYQQLPNAYYLYLINFLIYDYRGAELIEELRQKQMTLQEDQEVKILEKIKVKMERIKANQKKIQGALAKDPIHHDRGKYNQLVPFELFGLLPFALFDVRPIP